MKKTLLLALWLVGGCAVEETATGDVSLALTAPGADGATYRLTPGARLSVAGGTYYAEYALDGDEAVLRLPVPVGAYQAELVHDLGYSTEWPLERTDGTTTETVTATLMTTMPAAVDVVEDTATPLALTFQVEEVGPVTFAQGSLDVSVDVDEVPAAGASASSSAQAVLENVLVDPAAPATLAGLLPPVGTPAAFAANVDVAGPWYQSDQTGACAPATVTGYSVGDHAGLAALVVESVNGTAELCLYTFEGTTTARLFFYRSGQPPITQLFTDLAVPYLSFLTYLDAELPGAIFDGQTLHLDDLVGTQAGVPAFLFTRVSGRVDAADPLRRWYRAYGSGTLTFTFGS